MATHQPLNVDYVLFTMCRHHYGYCPQQNQSANKKY